MVIQYKESDTETYKCETHIFEVMKDGFKGTVEIVDHDGMVYVRQILPKQGGEKLNSFKFKSEIENEVCEVYKTEYKHRVNGKRYGAKRS